LPTNKTKARSFLGKVGYYRRFIKDYAAIAKPWNDIVGKDENREIEKAPIVATPTMVASYRHLKQALLTSPVLAYPQFDSKEPFILDTDCSGDANTIDWVLSQKQCGREKVIAVMIMRWYDSLSNFNVFIEHRPGKKHANADALSRCTHAEEPDPDDEPDEMIALMHEIINVLEPCVPDWDPAHICSQQLMDSDLEMIRTAVWTAMKPLPLAAFSPEGRAYVGLFEQLFFDEHDV
jgi:hypothetical protein